MEEAGGGGRNAGWKEAGRGHRLWRKLSGSGEQEEGFATFFAFASSTIEPAGDMPGETGLEGW